MLFEKSRAVFDIPCLLAAVEGGATKTGVVLDFDAKNQMVETNEVLEIYVTKTAKAKVTGEGEQAVTQVPKLQIKIYTGDDKESLAIVHTSEEFAVADLTEGTVLHKAALPDKCGQYVRVDLIGSVADNDFADGSVVGIVRPL